MNTQEFKKILLASFISQTGSHFLTLAIAAFVFSNSNSPIQASLVFVATFLPSVFVSSKLGRWIDESLSRKLIIRNELISIAGTILCGLCLVLKAPFFILCLVLSCRSILMFIGRTAVSKWIKIITPSHLQASRFKLYSLTLFLSSALSGILAGTILSYGSIQAVVLIDILTYVASISVYLALPAAIRTETLGIQTSRMNLFATLVSISKIPALKNAFLFVCLSQAIFQGAYSTLVSYLPIHQFNLGLKGVGFFQISASIGIIAGFLFVWFMPRAQDRISYSVGIFALGILALLACGISSEASTAILWFFILNLTYESVWLHMSSEFFKLSPLELTAQFNFTLSTSAAFLMSILTLGYAMAINYLSLAKGISTVLILSLLIAILIKCFSQKQRLLEEKI